MIATELLLAFATAAFAVILIPGPTVLLVTGYALSRGFKIALLSILGVCLGDAVAMMVTFLGLGAILAASAELFTTLKWIGAAYLIYLGIELWRAPLGSTVAAVEREYHPFEIVARGFTVNVVHPKGLAFYSAFLPQFISPEVPALPQMLILATTFIAIAFSILVSYALAAARFRSMIVQPRVRCLANRAGAICLIGAGFYTLTLNQGG